MHIITFSLGVIILIKITIDLCMKKQCASISFHNFNNIQFEKLFLWISGVDKIVYININLP